MPIATDGDAIITCWQAEGEDLWSVGAHGSQFVNIPDFEWSNPNGGLISDASNWIPSLPSTGDTVSVSIPAQFEISVSDTLPFSFLDVGPKQAKLSI